MNNPKISIITASYNSVKTIRDTILSVLNVNYLNYEYIIVDGGSTDGTIQIIEEFSIVFPEKIKWISEPDLGIYDAWNKALSMVTGEWICFLGSDDILLQDALYNYSQVIDSDIHVNFISSKVELVDKDLNHISIIGKEWSSKMKQYCTVAHVASLHKRSLFEKFGKFSLSYKICSDYEFLLRNYNNIKPLYINVVTAKMRTAGVSNTNIEVAFKETYLIKNSCNVNIAFINLLFLWRTRIAYKMKKCKIISFMFLICFGLVLLE